MKKVVLLSILMMTMMIVQGQIKVYSGGNVAIGNTSTTPQKPLDVIGSGGIRISQSGDSSSNNEIYFQDNGQIRSVDNNHRILFDRASDILELREYGNITFSPGATAGTRTQRVIFTSGGDINLTGASKSYQIAGNKVLWNNNITSCIFVGIGAGASTTGLYNTAIGNMALNASATGAGNTACGYKSLTANTSGAYNTGYGFQTLETITTASYNTALGYDALALCTSGGYNTSMGYYSLVANTSGANNTASGYYALSSNTTGSQNTGIGYNAGVTIVGGSSNTFVGYAADVTGTGAASYTNCAAFGQSAQADANNHIVIGSNSVTKIGGYQNWSNYSDGRFKINVKENVKGLDFIKKLRPVTYNMDAKNLDDFLIQNMPDSIKAAHRSGMDFTEAAAMVRSGFIAQEVEQAAQQTGYACSIVNAPANGSGLYSLAYAEFVVPLVKAVQELAGKTDSLAAIAHKQDSVLNARQNKPDGTGGRKAAGNDQDAINKLLQDQINNCCLKANTNGGSSIGAMLYQNIPNPFNQITNIKCFIPESSKTASLMIFDMNGTLKKSIAINQKSEVNITINARELMAGMYYYSLIIDNTEVDTKKMILTEQ